MNHQLENKMKTIKLATALAALSIAPARNVVFSLFRRREPMSRRKEAALLKLREMLKA